MGVAIKSTHSRLPVSEMVLNALQTLKSRNGSSLAAVKKQMASMYSVDQTKLASYIKRFIKSAIEKGVLIQTKGKGASGSFKLAKKQSNSNKTPKTRRTKPKKPRTPARKALFQTPQPGKPKPKANVFAVPFQLDNEEDED